MSNFRDFFSLQALKKQATDAWSCRAWRWESDCLFCGVSGVEPVCAGCVASLPRSHPACPSCALPMTVRETCGNCLRRPPAFDGAIACFAYRFPIDRAIQRFKFAGDLAVGRWLARGLAEAVCASAMPDVIVSPPTTRARLAARGFDPALQLARAVGTRLRVPCDPALVSRRRDTGHQPGLGRRSRRENLRDAFTCARPHPGLHVAIVDDVMTTGATAEAMARALRQAGVARIDVWAAARTPEPGGG
jgi:ComF family protein